MNAVDLFAGCGGLSLGFQKQGFNIVAAFDGGMPLLIVIEQISLTLCFKQIYPTLRLL